MKCIECKTKAPVKEDQHPNADLLDVLRHDFGWIELRWGACMRVGFCSTRCAFAFVSDAYGRITTPAEDR